ncbi:MAG TPA: ABC transporter substrate-binding protein [Burkholderiaceae bacterium]|nr:ABC transporter substrate-binding protein [Burkholderiaceae bacterium]
MKKQQSLWRRLAQGGLFAAAGVLLVPATASAQDTIRVGLMLPYTGTYARLGEAITNGFKLYVDQHGGKVGGLKVQYFAVDAEADPSKAPENTNRLIQRDNVDVLVGPVHSGVAIGMARIARDSDVIMIDPNAGADQITGPLCSPNIFRSSFSNWQPGYGTGAMMAKDGHKTAATLTWDYAAGEQQVNGFKEAFEKGGGKVVRQLALPFPQVEFQAYLTEIASLNPDAVFVFFAGGGAVKFTKDYAAAGLKGKIPLYGTGFLTDGTLEAQGETAEGVKTSLHYAESLDTPANKKFQQAYQKKYKDVGDVYAVQGYDAAQLLAIGVEAVKGDISNRDGMIEAMEGAVIDSPRGEWRMSDAHNPIQDFYARVVRNGDNVVTGIAVEDLADPARGCKM